MIPRLPRATGSLSFPLNVNDEVYKRRAETTTVSEARELCTYSVNEGEVCSPGELVRFFDSIRFSC